MTLSYRGPKARTACLNLRFSAPLRGLRPMTPFLLYEKKWCEKGRIKRHKEATTSPLNTVGFPYKNAVKDISIIKAPAP